MSRPWQAVADELARTADTGRPVRLWLRDDDAVAVTPALARLDTLCASIGLPVLLAVIPAGATADLAAWAATRPGIVPCQHGWSHHNHAGPDERACELGGARDDAAVYDDLTRGRDAMQALFGPQAAAILVPPWNRIRPSLLAALPGLGYAAISTFAAPGRPPAPLPEIDCDLDIIDWRHGRRGRTMADLCARLATALAAARADGRPIGLLTHHLVHDDAAWGFLEEALGRLAGHPAVQFVAAPALLPVA